MSVSVSTSLCNCLYGFLRVWYVEYHSKLLLLLLLLLRKLKLKLKLELELELKQKQELCKINKKKRKKNDAIANAKLVVYDVHRFF